MMRLGLVIALPAEGRALLGGGHWSYVDGRPYRCRALPGELEICGVRAGVGTGPTAAAARWMTGRGITALACLGTAGGLHPGLKRGDLVIARAVLVRQEHKIPRIWPTDPIWSCLAGEILAAGGIAVHSGLLLTTDQPVLSASGKADLFRRTDALAADMESGIVAQVAAEADLPFVAMRAVCDPADRAIPAAAYDSLGPDGRARLGRLFKNLIRNPGLAPELLQLRGDYAAALRTLRRAWRLYLQALLSAADGHDIPWDRKKQRLELDETSFHHRSADGMGTPPAR